MALMSLIRLPALYGVQMFPVLSSHHLSLCALWGGLLGLLFALPVLVGQPFARGLLFGFLIAAGALVVVLPLFFHLGLFAEKLGQNAWAFVTVYCIGWGLFTSFWHRASL